MQDIYVRECVCVFARDVLNRYVFVRPEPITTSNQAVNESLRKLPKYSRWTVPYQELEQDEDVYAAARNMLAKHGLGVAITTRKPHEFHQALYGEDFFVRCLLGDFVKVDKMYRKNRKWVKPHEFTAPQIARHTVDMAKKLGIVYDFDI